jgi:hypothetical protein
MGHPARRLRADEYPASATNRLKQGHQTHK